MKFIESSVKIIPQDSGMIKGYQHIEKAARNCYRSENLIGEDSYLKMLDILKERGHYSPLAHMTIYLTVESNSSQKRALITRYLGNPYSYVIFNGMIAFITTNFRVIVEHNWQDDLQFMTGPTLHQLRVTALVECSIGVSREWNRHTTIVPSEQSTRYCNYSKNKFGSEITYVIPEWIYKKRDEISKGVDPLDGKSLEYIKNLSGVELLNELACYDKGVCAWMEDLEYGESSYMYLINDCGFKPQEARGLLRLDTATTVYYTAFVKDWQHFFDLRCSPAAHPDIRVLAENLKEQFKKQNLL